MNREEVVVVEEEEEEVVEEEEEEEEEEVIIAEINYNVKEIEIWVTPYVDGDPPHEVRRRVVSNSWLHFSTTMSHLLSLDGAERFVTDSLSLVAFPSFFIDDLKANLADAVNRAALAEWGRGSNTMSLDLPINIITEHQDDGGLGSGVGSSLNDRQTGFGAVPATEAEIERALKKEVPEEDMEKLEHGCIICLEEFVKDTSHEVSQMPCGHVFHGPCIVQWLKRSNCCPVCRFRIQT